MVRIIKNVILLMFLFLSLEGISSEGEGKTNTLKANVILLHQIIESSLKYQYAEENMWDIISEMEKNNLGHIALSFHDCHNVHDMDKLYECMASNKANEVFSKLYLETFKATLDVLERKELLVFKGMTKEAELINMSLVEDVMGLFHVPEGKEQFFITVMSQGGVGDFIILENKCGGMKEPTLNTVVRCVEKSKASMKPEVLESYNKKRGKMISDGLVLLINAGFVPKEDNLGKEYEKKD